MFSRLGRIAIFGGFGCFMATNTFVYLRDRSPTEEPRTANFPRMPDFKNPSSQPQRDAGHFDRTRERLDKILERDPSARENLANFLEQLLGVEEEYRAGPEQSEEERKTQERKKEEKINKKIDDYMRDHISAREHLAHALEQMMHIEEQERDRKSGRDDSEEVRRERQSRVKKSVESFMEGDQSANKQIANVLEIFLNVETENPQEQHLTEEEKQHQEKREEIKKSVSTFMEENPSAKRHMLNLLDLLLNVDNGYQLEEGLTQEQIMRDQEEGRRILRQRMRRMRIRGGRELTEQEKKKSEELQESAKSVLDMQELLEKTHIAVEQRLQQMKDEESKEKKEFDQFMKEPELSEEDQRRFSEWKRKSEEAARRRYIEERNLEEEVEKIRRVVELKLEELRYMHRQRIRQEGDHSNRLIIVGTRLRKDEYVDDLMHYREDPHVVRDEQTQQYARPTNLKEKLSEKSAADRVREKNTSKVSFVN